MKTKLAALFAAAFMMVGAVGTASALTVNFDDGSVSGGVYTESGFQVSGLNGGMVAFPNDCGSRCLRLNNESSTHIYELSRVDGGAFNLDSFLFNGRDGEAPALNASSMVAFDSVLGYYVLDGAIYTFYESLNGNTMSDTGALSYFQNVTSVFFQSAGDGSARVDNLQITVSEVPLPAAGFLLIGGLGALGLMRRRKTA